MVRACTRWFFVGLIVLLVAPPAQTATKSSSPRMVRLSGHVLPALAKATALPSKPDSGQQPITLTIVLKRDDDAGFRRYLHELYDPYSKWYHHFLTQSEIADRFGPSGREYDQLIAAERANGFQVIERSKNRLTLTVRATRAQAERGFDVHISDYKLGQARFFANDRDPEIPSTIASYVQAVIGLSNLARPQPTKEILYHFGASLCKIAYSDANSPTQATDIQNCRTWIKGLVGYSGSDSADPPGWEQLDGTGQTIGLIEFDSFTTSDVANYLNLIGAPASRINNLSVDNVGGGAPAGANQDEVLLDIDTVMTIAPGAKVTDVNAPFEGAGSFQALFNRAISDGATIISNSWAYCEDQTTLADVQGLDTIFQSAAGSGVSIFNGSGDTGATCLDGSPNVIAVPADSPNATAVGGSSYTPGIGNTYGSELWWNGANATPPTGQGGFGVSNFFGVPLYQNGLAVGGRSIPDVVANADPANGVIICQASAGGCPSNLQYGGTSGSAPAWAGFAAILNQGLGSNIGAFNKAIYPFGNTGAFHTPASMTSDFAHVGLGSPNLNALFLALSGKTPGTPSASLSQILLYLESPTPSFNDWFADGSTTGYATVRLLDANSNPVPGKTVTLAAGAGSHAQISPTSTKTSADNGMAVFSITDTLPENVVFTATDTDDGIQLTNTQPINFVTPPATQAQLQAAPSSVNNDGKTAATITVILKDINSNPTPKKLVTLLQNGNSLISGPSPQVTDATGTIQFKVTDFVSESVTYSAVDVTDGNLPVPTTGQVTFTGSPSNSCAVAAPPAAPGFLFTPYATGFNTQNVSAGGVNFGCFGATGLGFDSIGNLYVNDFPLGNIYKFGPGGGVAGATTQLNASSLGVTLAGLVFDKAGHLFVSLDVTTGNFTTGAVEQINPSNGAVIQTSASSLTCPTTIAIDPLSQDLFTDDTCFGSGSDNPDIWRVSTPAGSPSTSVYTTTSVTPNATLAFGPGGTIYMWNSAQVAKVSGTNLPGPPSVTVLSGINVSTLGMIASGQLANGDATSLIETPFQVPSGTQLGIKNMDLTTTPPTIGTSFSTGSGFNFMIFGPDGCLYGSQQTTVYRITDASGACDYGSKLDSPTLVLSPTSVSPNPAQGTSQTFNAMLHYSGAPAGTQVVFSVAGTNTQVGTGLTDANGLASFGYAGLMPGQDTITATATVNSTLLTSNQAVVTWSSGKHTTFLSLNQNPTSATPSQTVQVIAALTDVSLNPVAAIANESIGFDLGGSTCSASTNAKGIATCQVTAGSSGVTTLTGSFNGDSSYLASQASQGFDVLTVPSPTPTPTSTPTPTPTPTPTATPTPTPTPTPTTTGQLLIVPPTLLFAADVGGRSAKPVVVTNISRFDVAFNNVSVSGPQFSISKNLCTGTLAPLRICAVTIQFSPKRAGQFHGVLTFTDSAQGSPQTVRLVGTTKEDD